jgi:hypothetical protein
MAMNTSRYLTRQKKKKWQGGIDTAENSKEIRMYAIPSAGDKCPTKSLMFVHVQNST